MSDLIERECEGCGHNEAVVGTVECEGQQETTWTCTRCQHPVWSCELDPSAHKRR